MTRITAIVRISFLYQGVLQRYEKCVHVFERTLNRPSVEALLSCVCPSVILFQAQILLVRVVLCRFTIAPLHNYLIMLPTIRPVKLSLCLYSLLNRLFAHFLCPVNTGSLRHRQVPSLGLAE